MFKKIYVASAYINIGKARQNADLLKSYGYEITSRWLIFGDEISNETAQMDLDDIDRADCLVLLNWNENPSITGGCHVEFGYALAKGKGVFLVGDKSNIFHELHEIKHFPVIRDFLSYLEIRNV